MRSAVLALALVPCLALAQGDVKQEIAKLKGTWTVVELVDPSGQKAPAEVLQNLKITFTDDKMVLDAGGRSVEMTYKLDPAQKPAAIDVARQKDGKTETAKGIYLLDGDTLKFCAAEPGHDRPKEFKTDAASMTGMMTLKRVKP